MADSSMVTLENLNQLPPLISTPVAASILSCSPQMVTHMCRNGKLKAVKVGSDWRINTAALLAQYGLSE